MARRTPPAPPARTGPAASLPLPRPPGRAARRGGRGGRARPRSRGRGPAARPDGAPPSGAPAPCRSRRPAASSSARMQVERRLPSGPVPERERAPRGEAERARRRRVTRERGATLDKAFLHVDFSGGGPHPAHVILGSSLHAHPVARCTKEQARGQRYAHDHGQPHRPQLRGARPGRDHQGHGSPADQGRGRRLRADDVRPGVHEHRRVPERHHLHRRRQGHPPLSRLSHRAAGRARDLPRGGLPPVRGRAAHQGAAEAVGRDDQVPHLRPHQHHQVPRGVPLRRAPDGDAAGRRGRAVHLLSRRQAHPRSGQPLSPARPAAGQGADHRGLRVPPFARACRSSSRTTIWTTSATSST